MKKGWYKKAKKKFIRTKVYSWCLYEPFVSSVKYGIEHNQTGAEITYCSKNHQYQVMEKAKGLGFIKGFLYVRRKHFEHPDFWLFHYDKRIEN